MVDVLYSSISFPFIDQLLTGGVPSNVLVSDGNDETNRTTDAQVCDFESTATTVPSRYALHGAPIGPPVFRPGVPVGNED